MLTVNEYFNGSVKSIAFVSERGRATLGVMAPGEFEFGTSSRELMEILDGEMSVRLPGSQEWVIYKSGSSFSVGANEKFYVRTSKDTAYLCIY